jgi:hypothetical protein
LPLSHHGETSCQRGRSLFLNLITQIQTKLETNYSIEEKWRNASWPGMLNLMKAYIRNRDSNAWSPGYYGPVDEETIPLVPILVELINLGVYPIGSQPQMHTRDIITSKQDRNSTYILECRQRACIGFMVPRELSKPLYKILAEKGDFHIVTSVPAWRKTLCAENDQ